MLKNLFSGNTTENVDVIRSRRQKMPFAGEGCDGCGSCARACPSGAVAIDGVWTMDAGKCIFCMECMDVCDKNALSLVDMPDYVLDRKDLVFRHGEPSEKVCGTIAAEKRRAIGRSIFIREVDTGSCNVCEIEVNSLSNQFYDSERFGIKVVASPRHADVLLVTGPLTENMHLALTKAVSATPDPKVIVAMGTCAISGGLFTDGAVIGNGIHEIVHVDMFIPGCPPSPDKLIRAFVGAFGLKY